MLRTTDVGCHLVAGFTGTTLDDQLAELLKLGVGGLILFSRNYESCEQLADLIRQIRDAAGRRIFIGVDQEGGRVARLSAPFTDWPDMATLGATGDTALAEQFGVALADELAAVGIDWDFAPVMDVNSNPDNPVIGDRAFGQDPERVIQMGVSVLCAMQKKGVMACAKHFPGHGDTDLDSHKALPKVLARDFVLHSRELTPFTAAVDAGVGSIMTAHVVYPVWDLAHPASLSRVLVEGMLRRAIGFQGLVITDDLEMAAVADRYEPQDLIMLAFHAGTDMLLACHTFELQEGIVQVLFDARCNGLLPEPMFSASQKRIAQAQNRFSNVSGKDLSVVGCEKHLSLARQIRDRGQACG